MANRLLSALAFLLLAGDALAGGPTGAETQLDVALVIAVDVSSSMEGEEQGLQREGFIEAFRSSLVHDAIENGAYGRIAVTYMEWSGVKDQRVLVPWTIIDSAGRRDFLCQSARLSADPAGRNDVDLRRDRSGQEAVRAIGRRSGPPRDRHLRRRPQQRWPSRDLCAG